MGQYGNQPDFGVTGFNTTPTGTTYIRDGVFLNSAALYIGTGGTLVVTLTGGNKDHDNDGATVFYNVPDGTFMPIIVDYVWAQDDNGNTTSCSDIVALY